MVAEVSSDPNDEVNPPDEGSPGEIPENEELSDVQVSDNNNDVLLESWSSRAPTLQQYKEELASYQFQ